MQDRQNIILENPLHVYAQYWYVLNFQILMEENIFWKEKGHCVEKTFLPGGHVVLEALQ